MNNENVANAEMQADFEKFYDMLLKLNDKQRKIVLEILHSEDMESTIEKKKHGFLNSK